MRFFKKLLLASLAFVLAIFFTNYIAERFFFDKIFFGKSENYGYSKKVGAYNMVNMEPFSPLLEKRITDLRHIVSLGKNEIQGHVMGANTAEGSVFNIALIGDSFVYGMGVKLEDTIGKHLEKKLNTTRRSKVYSLALSGDSILDDYAKLQLAEKYLQPDVSVIVIVENDTNFDFIDKYPGGQEIFDRISPLCPGKLYVFDYKNVVTIDDVTTLVDYPSWSPDYRNICLVRSIVTEMNQRDRIFYVALSYPFDSQELKSYGSSEASINAAEVMEKYVSFIQETHGNVVFPKRELIYKQVSQKEGHSSGETNKEYADIIYNELVSNPKWKFAIEK